LESTGSFSLFMDGDAIQRICSIGATSSIGSDEHAQTSVSEHGARHSAARRRPRRRRKQHAGSLEVDAQPSAARIRLPRARHGRPLPRCGELTSGTPREIGPRTGTWKDPDPRRRSSRGSGRLRIGLPGNSGYTMPAACPVSRASWRYGPRRTCRDVTGRPHRPRPTWPDQARLPLPAVTHRYKRAHCL